jgi:hypothetical protein
MTEFESRVLGELSVLKMQMEQLMGGMQPGRLTSLEQKVERHELYVQRSKGVAGAFGVVLTLINVAIDVWRHGH